jgi:hypothetical protein
MPQTNDYDAALAILHPTKPAPKGAAQSGLEGAAGFVKGAAQTCGKESRASQGRPSTSTTRRHSSPRF